MSMVGPEKHQVNERARSGFELAAHWKCDYSALPRLETERKRAPERSDSFFYVLKSAPRFLLLTPNVHGLLIDCIGRRFVGTIREGTSIHTHYLYWRRLILAAMACLVCAGVASAADDTALTKDQIKQFLLTAKIVGGKHTGKGVTQPWRLTLSDGTITHDASFQAIDEHKTNMQFASGRSEMNFVDSYKYNIAAYSLAELIGLDDIVPVYVERKWKGDSGSLSWWLPVKMDEEERHKQNLVAPDTDAWNKQMYKVRVLDQLVYDNDPNLTNVLISEDWKIWRIDFTRSFRTFKDLRNPGDLVRCDRQLFEKLKALDANQLAEKTKHYLTKDEVKAVMARRDKIVDRFQKLIAEKGENEVLY